jgi:hypothetical protein
MSKEIRVVVESTGDNIRRKNQEIEHKTWVTKHVLKTIPFVIIFIGIALIFNPNYNEQIIGGSLLVIGIILSLFVFKKIRKYAWITLGLFILFILFWGYFRGL